MSRMCPSARVSHRPVVFHCLKGKRCVEIYALSLRLCVCCTADAAIAEAVEAAGFKLPTSSSTSSSRAGSVAGSRAGSVANSMTGSRAGSTAGQSGRANADAGSNVSGSGAAKRQPASGSNSRPGSSGGRIASVKTVQLGI